MELTCDRKSLLAAVEQAARVVPKTAVRPILQCVLLDARADGVELLATDLEVGLRLPVSGVNVIQPGTAAFPCAKLLAILRECGSDAVCLEVLEDKPRICRIIAPPGGKFKVALDVAEDFPEIATLPEGAASLDGATFAEMVKKTAFASHQGQHRYALNGVLVNMEGDTALLVATDGTRLAEMRRPLGGQCGVPDPGEGDMKPHPVCSIKGLDTIVKLLEGGGEPTLAFAFRENGFIAQTQNGTVIARLIEGHFPDYVHLLPRYPPERTATVPVADFASAVKRAAIGLGRDCHWLAGRLTNGTLHLHGEGESGQEADAEIAVEYAGEDIAFTLADDHMSEYLAAAKGYERVEMGVGTPREAITFHPVGDKGYVYVSMQKGD